MCEGLGAQVDQTWSCPQGAEEAEVGTVQLTEEFESGPSPPHAVCEEESSETHHRAEQGEAENVR